jgi:hypothetical protein
MYDGARNEYFIEALIKIVTAGGQNRPERYREGEKSVSTRSSTRLSSCHYNLYTLYHRYKNTIVCVRSEVNKAVLQN